MKFGHPKPYGEKDCRLEPIKNDEELKRDDCAKNELRKEARKRKRNTIDESNRSDEVKKSRDDNNTMKKEQLQEEKRRLEKIISEQEKKKDDDYMDTLSREIKSMKEKVQANNSALAKYNGAKPRNENTGNSDKHNYENDRANQNKMRGL